MIDKESLSKVIKELILPELKEIKDIQEKMNIKVDAVALVKKIVSHLLGTWN